MTAKTKQQTALLVAVTIGAAVTLFGFRQIRSSLLPSSERVTTRKQSKDDAWKTTDEKKTRRTTAKTTQPEEDQVLTDAEYRQLALQKEAQRRQQWSVDHRKDYHTGPSKHFEWTRRVAELERAKARLKGGNHPQSVRAGIEKELQKLRSDAPRPY